MVLVNPINRLKLINNFTSPPPKLENLYIIKQNIKANSPPRSNDLYNVTLIKTFITAIINIGNTNLLGIISCL